MNILNIGISCMLLCLGFSAAHAQTGATEKIEPSSMCNAVAKALHKKVVLSNAENAKWKQRMTQQKLTQDEQETAEFLLTVAKASDASLDTLADQIEQRYEKARDPNNLVLGMRQIADAKDEDEAAENLARLERGMLRDMAQRCLK